MVYKESYVKWYKSLMNKVRSKYIRVLVAALLSGVALLFYVSKSAGEAVKEFLPELVGMCSDAWDWNKS